MIEFKNVSKKYKDQVVIKECNLVIEKGEFFVLVGPSGSGKTTTLKMINRLIEPTNGDIYFNQKKLIDYNLRDLRLNIGYVLQQIALFPNLTVAENIELIPEMKHWTKEEQRKRTTELLKLVQLDPEEYLHRKPAELSGGEQQRVGILRALAAKPDVLLMDEPFSALDPISREQLQVLIKTLHQELSVTIVFVTHDMKEAVLLGDRIGVMKEGVVIQIDTPDEIRRHPISTFVAQFFKEDATKLENYTIEDLFETIHLETTTEDKYPHVTLETSLIDAIKLINIHSVLAIELEETTFGLLNEKVMLCFLEAKIKKAEEHV